MDGPQHEIVGIWHQMKYEGHVCRIDDKARSAVRTQPVEELWVQIGDPEYDPAQQRLKWQQGNRDGRQKRPVPNGSFFLV